jgi:hypothetical protein
MGDLQVKFPAASFQPAAYKPAVSAKDFGCSIPEEVTELSRNRKTQGD